MQLKSVELHGFKSFPDKTRVEFDKGMTAVVGPNGSGKSNISDAVKWALGEQSTKELRGKKMDDVIFDGTQKRKAMGYAQVTLNINNKSRNLPYDTDEVAITRKLYKTGDSEYMINGQNVRLKDIHELFMDTGLGRDGYSIIGQGKIDDIVSAKSTDRREIFEEAAGISKFRYRKQEAERKLVAAEDNILRLKDVTAELEERIGPLKRQSEKAAIFIKVSEEKKQLDVSISVDKLNSHKDNMSKLEAGILKNQSEEKQLQIELNEIELKSQQAFDDMQKCSLEIDEARNKSLERDRFVSESASAIAVLKNDIVHNEATIERIHEQCAGIDSSYKEYDEKIASHKKLIEEIEQVNKEIESEYEKYNSELEGVTEEGSAFDENKQALSNEINRLYIASSHTGIEIASAKEALELAKQKQNDFSIKIEEQENQLSVLDKEFSQINEKMSAAVEKKSENENKFSGYSKLLASKQDKLSSLQEKCDKQVVEINSIKSKITVLNDLERNMEGYFNSVKEIIKASTHGKISGIHGTVGQLLSVNEDYTLAIETVLGTGMQNVVVDSEDTAKRAIYYLKDNRLGRATFLPLTSVRGTVLAEKALSDFEGYIGLAYELVTYDNKYDGIIKSLLGRIAVVDDINTATKIAKKFGYKFKIVTLDGQTINAGGSFTGGSSVKNAGVLSRKQELSDLQKELTKLVKENEALAVQLDSLREERDKLVIDTDGAREIISECEIELAGIVGEQNRINALSKQLTVQISELKSEIEKLNDQESSLSEQIKIKTAELSETQNQLAQKNEEISKSADKQNTIAEKSEKLSSIIYELKLKQIESGKDIEAHKMQIEELENRKLSLNSSGSGFEEEINQLIKENENKKAEIENLSKQIEESNREVTEISDKISELQSKRVSLEKLRNELHSDEKEATDHKQIFSNEVVKLTERKESMQRDYDNIINMLWEDYQLTRSEAVELAEPIKNMIEAIAKQTELRQKIKSLGNVNVGAIEEYKEVSERYKFLSEQLDDIYKSKAELEKIIQDMTVTICERFKESFYAINENFKKIFIDLFDGGKGELVLENPDDLLETGVEIYATPPGKLIKHLSSLSGGEKALVATAVYFAILQYRPSPFCILDEIDAPLDDVNVAKYAQYIRMFTEHTQFILITHRRPTMEEADILYGVTMQEKGVSKLLKMDAKQAEDLD